MKRPTLPKAFSQYGSSVGRCDDIKNPLGEYKFHLYGLPLQGDYDSGGAYWGYVRGQPMWHAYETESDCEMFVRAISREAAKSQVLKTFPKARFFR